MDLACCHAGLRQTGQAHKRLAAEANIGAIDEPDGGDRLLQILFEKVASVALGFTMMDFGYAFDHLIWVSISIALLNLLTSLSCMILEYELRHKEEQGLF